MKYFFVDVSTDQEIPLKSRGTTIVLGGAQGAGGSPYAMTETEWLRARKLASTGGGTLYWRVRALDKDKALATGSAVMKLVFDGGTWTVGDIDLSAATPSLAWDHTAQGYAGYSIQFSTDDQFDHDARTMIKVPSGSIADQSYTLSEQEMTRLGAFAERNAVTHIYYRVRAEDAGKAFVTFSPAKTTPAP